MKKAVILTRDSLFFEKLSLAWAAEPGPIPLLTCVTEFPAVRDPNTLWMADLSEAGAVNCILPPECSAFFTEQWEGFRNGTRTIVKYRAKSELLLELREICGNGTIWGSVSGENGTKILWVTSAAGGTGVSAVAAAAAMAAAPDSFYLNLESLITEFPFTVTEGPDLGNVLYCLSARPEADAPSVLFMAERDRSGVSFFRPPRSPGDMEGVTEQTARVLLDTLQRFGKYNRIVVDCPFRFDGVCRAIGAAANAVLLVNRENRGKNEKLREILQKQWAKPVLMLRNCSPSVPAENPAVPEIHTASAAELRRQMAQQPAVADLWKQI